MRPDGPAPLALSSVDSACHDRRMRDDRDKQRARWRSWAFRIEFIVVAALVIGAFLWGVWDAARVLWGG